MKKFLYPLLPALVVFSEDIYAQGGNYAVSSGSIFSVVPISGSSATWLGLQNAASSDDQYAASSASVAYSGEYTDYLIVTDFGMGVPDGSYIYGIKVEIEKSADVNRARDYAVQIVKNGVIGSVNKRNPAVNWAVGADGNDIYGDSLYLWGDTWTPADLNAPGFGVAIAAMRLGGGPVPVLFYIDHVSVTVYYSVILPAGLVDFTGSRSGEAVNLEWTTSSEINNDFFIVKRGSIMDNMEDIGKVAAAGNSPVPVHYSFSDLEPFYGMNYYRLKQVDYEGNYYLSPPISVRYDSHDGRFVVYPSLLGAGETFYVNIEGITDDKVLIVLLDPLGKEVYSIGTVTAYKNAIVTINLAGDLPPGIYMLTGSSRTQKFKAKVVVQ